MIVLRAYLLIGLLGHKLVWEILKRRASSVSARSRPRSARLAAIKAVKWTILIGVVVQTMLPDVLALTSEPLYVRLVGVSLYTLGLAVAVSARVQLGRNWSDIETAQVLPNQAVVGKGLYRYIRHPIYVGDLLLLLGLELSLNSWLCVVVALLVPPVLWKAVREERMLVVSLPGYAQYCTLTKRFIPFVV